MYDVFGLSIDVIFFCFVEGCWYCMMFFSFMDFYYNFGDINIGVVLLVYNVGNERYFCDGDNFYGMVQVLVIQYVIENLNVDMLGIFNNVCFGMVMFDVCENFDVVLFFFNNLFGN